MKLAKASLVLGSAAAFSPIAFSGSALKAASSNEPSVSRGGIRTSIHLSLMAGLKFTPSHEWAMDNEDGTVMVGITNHAQELLGDVAFVDLPEEGDEINVGENFSLVESMIAARDVYAPVSGEVVEVNGALEDSPELINQEPEEGGWIAKIKMSDPSELNALADAEAYFANME